ncbi:MAG: hypothetical protein J6P29_02440, partial [Acetobacter sp.]|nr:hypothetical protein [Acetobacter sp.]
MVNTAGRLDRLKRIKEIAPTETTHQPLSQPSYAPTPQRDVSPSSIPSQSSQSTSQETQPATGTIRRTTSQSASVSSDAQTASPSPTTATYTPGQA